MRSPAAALGATATLVDNRVGEAFARLDGPAIAELSATLEVEARSRRLSYLRDDVAEPVRVLPRPIVALHEQLSYARYAAFTVQYALKRLPQMYVTDPAVRALFNLTGEEEAWLRDCWTPAHREVNPLFGRIDGVLDFATPNWRESLCFLEPNLGGIGGLHMIPTVDGIVADVVMPRLSAVAPGLRLAPNVDLRELLAQELVDHLELIGRSGSRVCLVEPKYSGYGPDEQAQLADYLRARHGITVMHADPTELHMSGGDVTYEGEVVDVAYRDYTVLDLVELASEGVDVTPMRTLLKENRMVSSIAAELDQKSCWEVLTDPVLSLRHFGAEERLVFRRHVAWTRLLSDRRTTLPDGKEGDLLEFVRRGRGRLVLKPNRGYGGDGVKVGPTMDDGAWTEAIDRALADSEDRWVAQDLARLPTVSQPAADRDGTNRRDERFFVVLGFSPSKYGLGVAVRVSQCEVVNVAQHGGVCAMMVVQGC
jgi:hypothetical protein